MLNFIKLKKYIYVYKIEHIPAVATPPAAQAAMQTPCAALQATAAGGAPTPRVIVPMTRPADA